MQFTINAHNHLARVGSLQAQPAIQTPVVIQPANVLDILTSEELLATGSHALYCDPLRRSLENKSSIENSKQWMRWPGILFTESGGELAYSLAKTRGRKKDGVNFHSPFDQHLVHLTPQLSLQLQQQMGANVYTALSRAENYYAPVDDLSAATEQTVAWWKESKPSTKIFAPIVGGGLAKLRRASINGIGATAAGYSIQQIDQIDDATETDRILHEIITELPDEAPRMVKIGSSWNRLLVALKNGVDLIETDLALVLTKKHLALTSTHGHLAIKQSIHTNQTGPIDVNCHCSACHAKYEITNIAYLFSREAVLGERLLLMHNLTQLNQFIEDWRAAVIADKIDQLLTLEANRF